MPEPTQKLDPNRLLILARTRDRARSVLAGANEKYHEIREKRADVLRRAGFARQNAEAFGPTGRAAGEAQAASLEAEAAELSRQMEELRAELDHAAEEASGAARLLASCLAFAKDAGLDIPPTLAAEARDRHPTLMVQ